MDTLDGIIVIMVAIAMIIMAIADRVIIMELCQCVFEFLVQLIMVVMTAQVLEGVVSQNSAGTSGGGSARGTSTADRLRKKLQQKRRDQGSGSTSSPPGGDQGSGSTSSPGDQAWADAFAFAEEADKTEAPSQSKKSKRRAAKKAARKAAVEERSLAQAMDEAYSCDEDEQPEQPTPPAAAELPEELFCPLTHELMFDPVLLVQSGQTYERAPLVHWLETHDTDPMTGAHLTNRDVTDNILVRSMCRRYA